MGAERFPSRLPIAAMLAIATMVPAGTALAAQGDIRVPGVWQPGTTTTRNGYDAGYREGLQRGEQDRKNGREFNYNRDGAYRDGDRGYERTFGSRDAYKTEFRRGFATGYRVGYERYRVTVRERHDDRRGRAVPRGYQEPAMARGYHDGFDTGLDDGRERDRYDPVRHSDYREADQGYERDYGSKDVYKNNYRAGFRQGYEDGYREGARRK